MARLMAVMGFVVAMLAAPAIFAKDHDRGEHGGGKSHQSVPELSTAGAAGGLVVVGAAVAIALGRRKRKS
jgi:hypothetical protein